MLRSCTILAAALLLFPITAPAADEPAQMAPVVVTAPGPEAAVRQMIATVQRSRESSTRTTVASPSAIKGVTAVPASSVVTE